MSLEQPFKLSETSHWRRCANSLFHRRGPADPKHRGHRKRY